MTHRPDSAVAENSGTEFKPHPDGQHAGVCVDVINLGLKAEEYQGKPKLAHKVVLVYRTGEKRDDGKYFEVSKELTLTMGTKGNLRPFLVAWRGKSFTDEEAQKFDVAKLHGAPCLLTIEHKVSPTSGRTYANIIGISKLFKGVPVPEVGLDEYERASYWEDRKKEYAEGVRKRRQETEAPKDVEEHPEPVEPEGEDQDDLPF